MLEVYKKRQTAGIRGGSDDTLYEFKRVTTAMLATLGAHTPWESLKKPDWKRLRTRLEKPLNRKYQTLGKKLMTRLLGHVKTCAKLASKEWGFASPAFGIGWDDVAEGHRPSPIRNRPGKSPIARKAYDQDECWSIIFDAPPLEQAACLLGLNGGMGAADIGVMRISDLDLETGWFNDVRSKVKKIRRFRMWPETVAAIKRVLNETPRNPLFPDYIFLGHAESNDPLLRSLTHPPRPLVRERPNGSREACVFSKFLCRHIRNCGFDDPRRFYGLRHTFEWCGDHLDERVTSDIMTHSIMADVRNGKGYYRTASHDARSRDVTDFVRNWVILKGDDDPTKFVRATDSPYEPLPDPVPLISKSR